MPVVEGILRERPQATVSVDTYRAATARLAIETGAEIVNDVSGLQWDEGMAAVCAETGCGVVLMHTRGLPSAWSAQPRLAPGEVLPLLLSELGARASAARDAGFAPERIVLDPGFGFGKLGGENWTLLAEFVRLHKLGYPLLAGMSRKGFLTAPETPPAGRDTATHAAGVVAVLQGAQILRVHDVHGAREAVRVVDAL